MLLLMGEIPYRLGKGATLWAISFYGYLLFAVLVFIYLVRKNLLNLEKTARLCERHFPVLGDGLISLVQLGKAKEKGRADFSLTFFEKHLERIWEKFSRLNLIQILKLNQLVKTASGFLLLSLLWILLWVFVPGFGRGIGSALAFSQWRAEGGGGFFRTSRALELYDFILEYNYPAYSGLEPKRIEGSDGSVVGLVGSEVQIQARSMVSLSRLWLELAEGEKLKAEQEGKILSARLTIKNSGGYRFCGEDAQGKLWAESGFHKIQAIPDQPPTIHLLAPKNDLVVQPDQELVIRFQGDDDYGLESIWLIFKTSAETKRILIQNTQELELEGEYRWQLGNYRLIPGEKIAYYLEAQDNNHITGPGIGRSQTRYLEVYSPLKEHEKIIAQEQKLFENLIELLSQHLVFELDKSASGFNFWEKEENLISGLVNLKNFLDELAQKVKNDQLSTELVLKAIQTSEDRYGNLITRRQKALKTKNQTSSNSTREKSIYWLERDIIFWDGQLKKQRLDYLLALAEKLKKGQEELTRLLEEYQKNPDPALLEEIESRLEELKQVYQEYLSRLGELSQTLPDEFVNLDALKQISAGEVYEKLEQFRQAVHDRDVQGALEQAQEFLSQLDRMLSQLQQGAEKLGSALSSEIISQLDQSIDQLGEIIQGQENLIRLTQPFAQKWQEILAQAEKNLEEKIKQLEKELELLEQGLKEQSKELNQFSPSKEISGKDRQEFYQKRSRLGYKLWEQIRSVPAVKNHLENRKLEKAKQKMERMIENLQELNSRGEELAKQCPLSQSQSWAKSSKENLARAEKIKKEIEKLISEQKPSLSPEQMAQLQGLSLEQKGLGERTQKLRENLEELFQSLPVAPQRVSSHLNQAEQKMRDAQGELELANPDLGFLAEKEAKYWLEQAENQLKKFKKEIEKNSRPSPGLSAFLPLPSGAGSEQGKQGTKGTLAQDFEIPKAQQNQMSQELKKQILRVMQEPSPKEYQELNRDYYQRLLK